MVFIIRNIVINITEQMIQESLIDSEQKQDYIYALTMLIEKTISVGTILCISIFIRQLLPTLVFLIYFMELRKRTGGYHANTFLLCYVETIGTYVIVLNMNYLFLDNYILFFYMILCGSVCIIFGIGTVNHPNLHMSEEEMLVAKEASRRVLLIQVIVLCLFKIINIQMIIINYMAFAIIMCAISVCIAKLLRQEVNEYEEN